MKVIRSLENRGILLKQTNRKINSQERGFLNFLGPLLTSEFCSMKNVLEVPNVSNVSNVPKCFDTIGINSSNISSRCSY